jgi:hypothetical protein
MGYFNRPNKFGKRSLDQINRHHIRGQVSMFRAGLIGQLRECSHTATPKAEAWVCFHTWDLLHEVRPSPIAPTSFMLVAVRLTNIYYALGRNLNEWSRGCRLIRDSENITLVQIRIWILTQKKAEHLIA